MMTGLMRRHTHTHTCIILPIHGYPKVIRRASGLILGNNMRMQKTGTGWEEHLVSKPLLMLHVCAPMHRGLYTVQKAASICLTMHWANAAVICWMSSTVLTRREIRVSVMFLRIWARSCCSRLGFDTTSGACSYWRNREHRRTMRG